MIKLYKLPVLASFLMISFMTASGQIKKEVKAAQKFNKSDSFFIHTKPYGTFRTNILIDGFKAGMTKAEVQERKLKLVAEDKVQADNSVIYQNITVNGKTAHLGYYFEYVNVCDTCPEPLNRLGSVTLSTRNVNKIDRSAGIFDAGDLTVLLSDFKKRYPGAVIDTLYNDRIQAQVYQVVNGNIAIVVSEMNGQIGISYRDLVFMEPIMHKAWSTKEYPRIESGE